MGKALTLPVSLLVPRTSVEAFWVVGDLVPLPYGVGITLASLQLSYPLYDGCLCA